MGKKKVGRRKKRYKKKESRDPWKCVRKPLAPPTMVHKVKSKYDRKREKERVRKEIDEEQWNGDE